jgi:diacylglycerol kinase family enzyme
MRFGTHRANRGRVTLIPNPGAGREAGDAAPLRGCVEAGGYDVRDQSVKEDGWTLWRETPADLVMVAGGDGTVARVARRMVGRGVPIAVLPCGTANNIARSLGVVERSFEDLVRGLDGARRVKLDIGTVRAPWGGQRFVEGVGAGLFADLLGRASSEAPKARKGSVESALRRLRKLAAHCEPLEIAASLDGRDISGRYLLVEALNLPYVGPNLHLAHESHPGDGELDVVVVREAERARLLHYLEHWQENRERLAMLPTLRGRRVKIEWTGFALHIDDKLRPKEDAEASAMAGVVEARLTGEGVEFLLPA